MGSMSTEQDAADRARRRHDNEDADAVTRFLAERDPEYDLHTERLVDPEEVMLKDWLPHATPTDGGAPAP